MVLLVGRMVGEARFELARLATPAPKAGASAVPPLARWFARVRRVYLGEALAHIARGYGCGGSGAQGPRVEVSSAEAPPSGSSVRKREIARRAAAAASKVSAASAAFHAVRAGPGGPSTIWRASASRALRSLIGS